MSRGEIWSVSGGVYASKPRPALILQSDQFSETSSITVAPFTTDPTDAPLFRLPIPADPENGLRSPCSIMIDKVTTISRNNLGSRIGRLGDDDVVRVNRAVIVFLGIA
ncbi:MAG: type II toxin-antitoxin system PemK/MazF family toxin [Alphaproteobacteria bacterium]|nr:type II toxin-antitoxin system PemK/MazF family toxin [Alphaproteobacteria bacterium]